MNLEKVVFGVFIILSATLNFGFVYGDPADPDHHHVYEFFAVFVVTLVATVLKVGDRTQIGAIHLATSLAAILQLTAAAITWFVAARADGPVTASYMVLIVSLAAGALLANGISVVMLIIETVTQRR